MKLALAWTAAVSAALTFFGVITAVVVQDGGWAAAGETWGGVAIGLAIVGLFCWGVATIMDEYL